MITRKNCIFHKRCRAPLCPLQSREDNLKQIWGTSMPVCRWHKDVPFWVEQQRRIVHQIKPNRTFGFFDLLMLEAPVEITDKVKGIKLASKCLILAKIKWLEKNKINSLPEELKNDFSKKYGDPEKMIRKDYKTQ